MRAIPLMMKAFLNICASCLPERIKVKIVELLVAKYVRRQGGAIAAEARFPAVPQ
jgi:hypothetical protein